MFNIKTLVNKITDRGRESQPNSPGRGQGDDILSRQVAEGFLCPKCMKAFPSQEDLQRHYLSSHDGGVGDESEGFLCPKCMKTCSTPEDLETHYLTTHSADMDDEPLAQSIGEKVVPEQLDVEAIGDVEELKRLLFESYEYRNTLLQEKERLEHRAAQLARDNATLRAASDEGEGNQVALKERLKVVEAQLAHRESIDDAAVLRQELVQVQRVMDELTREKERERDELKAELQQLKDVYSTKEHEDSTSGEVLQLERKVVNLEGWLEQKEVRIENLELAVYSTEKLLQRAQENINEKLSEVEELEKELGLKNSHVQQQEKMIEVLQTQTSEMKTLKQQLDDFKSLSERSKKMIEEKDEEVKSSQARLDALNKQKDILKSELQHKTKLCEELEKSNSENLKELAQKKEEISRLESERAHLVLEIQAGEGASAAIQQLSQDKELLQKKVKQQTETYTKNVNDLEKQIEKLLREREEMKKEIEQLKKDFKETLKNLETITKELQVLTKVVEETKSEKDSLRSTLDTGGSESDRNESLESALDRNSSLLLEATEKVRILHAMFEQCRTKADNIEMINRKLESKVKEKETAMVKLHADLKNLETRLGDAMTEMKTLESELHSERSSKVKMHEELNLIENEISMLRSSLTQKEKSIETLESKNVELQKNLQETNCEKQRIEEELKKELVKYKALLDESKLSIVEHEKEREKLLNDNKEFSKLLQDLEKSLEISKESITEKEQSLIEQAKEMDSLKTELTLERNKCSKLENEKTTFEMELNKKADDLKKVQDSLDEVAGEKLALEAQLAASQSEQQALLERCFASSAESENQRKNNADLRRKLEESQAALHELGRENQTLQLELEKLVGRKWTEDSDAVSCTLCQKEFSILVRKHHCRNCGQIFCNECSSKMASLQTNKKPVRVCDSCYNELGNK